MYYAFIYSENVNIIRYGKNVVYLQFLLYQLNAYIKQYNIFLQESNRYSYDWKYTRTHHKFQNRHSKIHA